MKHETFNLKHSPERVLVTGGAMHVSQEPEVDRKRTQGRHRHRRMTAPRLIEVGVQETQHGNPVRLGPEVALQRIAAVRNAAQASNLGDLAAMFNEIEGMPRADIEARVKNALKWLMGKPEHKNLQAQLELVELNLPNLK